jgi:hypothetical protein
MLCNSLFVVIEKSWIKVVSATSGNLKNTSFGVLYESVLRGRWLRRASTLLICLSLIFENSPFLGEYCRTNPLVFSFRPRSHDE